MSRNAVNQDSPQAEPRLAKDTAAAAQTGRTAGVVPGSLTVDIYDQAYYLRGPDPGYLEQLAALVDAKMRAVAQSGTTVDSLRVAVLAALNIADELVTLRQQRDALAGSEVARNLKSRTETLAEMLDAALEDTRKAG